MTELDEWRAALRDLSEFDRAADEPDHDEPGGNVGAPVDAGALCRALERDAQRRRKASRTNQ